MPRVLLCQTSPCVVLTLSLCAPRVVECGGFIAEASGLEVFASVGGSESWFSSAVYGCAGSAGFQELAASTLSLSLVAHRVPRGLLP